MKKFRIEGIIPQLLQFNLTQSPSDPPLHMIQCFISIKVMGSVGPYRLREPLILVCMGEGDSPQQLIWYRNGAEYDADMDPVEGVANRFNRFRNRGRNRKYLTIS